MPRIVISVRGENIGALTLVIKMRPASPATAIIARELALRLFELSFPPDAVPTQGIAHVIADRLYRIHPPVGEKYQKLRPALWKAKKTTVPERNATWCRPL